MSMYSFKTTKNYELLDKCLFFHFPVQCLFALTMTGNARLEIVQKCSVLSACDSSEYRVGHQKNLVHERLRGNCLTPLWVAGLRAPLSISSLTLRLSRQEEPGKFALHFGAAAAPEGCGFAIAAGEIMGQRTSGQQVKDMQ